MCSCSARRPSPRWSGRAPLVPGSGKEIARTSIGVAVRAGAPVPDISTAEAFKQALRDARTVAFSDAAVGGSAGVHLAALWGRIGMAEEIARKGMPQRSGGEVAARVAEGAADIGLTLIAEIVPVAGARVIGKLPAPLGNDTTYAAGISATCTNRTAAAAFVAALARPSGRDVWTAAGFECIGQCPDSEARISSLQAQLRASESKGH